MSEVAGSALRVASGYRFVASPGLADPAALRDEIREFAAAQRLTGTVLLASEGINLSICGPDAGIDAFEAFVRAIQEFSGIRLRRTVVGAGQTPFRRLRVRLRNEIVTFDGPAAAAAARRDPTRTTGFLDAAAWNQMLRRDDVTVLDTRNHYEWSIGRFRGAEDPGIGTFRDLAAVLERFSPEQRRKPLLTYCTGGIRCEKLGGWLLDQGFEQAFQLRGGILGYLEDVNADPVLENVWEGDCFVFDDRVALTGELQPAAWSQCHACHHPLGFRELDSADYVRGVSCPYCVDRRQPASGAEADAAPAAGVEADVPGADDAVA